MRASSLYSLLVIYCENFGSESSYTLILYSNEEDDNFLATAESLQEGWIDILLKANAEIDTSLLLLLFLLLLLLLLLPLKALICAILQHSLPSAMHSP